MTGTTWLIVVSERVAVVLLVRISRTRLPGFEKTALTVLAVVPLIGPFFAWWLCHQPVRAPPSLQDCQGMSLNAHDRWRDVFDE
jgi:hypothetical protein